MRRRYCHLCAEPIMADDCDIPYCPGCHDLFCSTECRDSHVETLHRAADDYPAPYHEPPPPVPPVVWSDEQLAECIKRSSCCRSATRGGMRHERQIIEQQQ